MMTTKTTIAVLLASLMLCGGYAWAQEDAAPAEAPKPEAAAADDAADAETDAQPKAETQEQQLPPLGDLKATIVAVEGLVQVRENAEADWSKAETEMVLGPGAEFRTGPRSMVQFVIDPDHVVTLDRLGQVTILQAVRNEEKILTDLGMKYGRCNYAVEAGGIEHETSIRSPGSTLAVRGTDATLDFNGAFGPSVIVNHSEGASFRTTDFGRVLKSLLERGVIKEGDNGPADTARSRTFSPWSLDEALQKSEHELLTYLQRHPHQFRRLLRRFYERRARLYNYRFIGKGYFITVY